MAVDIIPTSTDGTDLRIGIVVSRFNEYAGRGEFEACMDELRKLGVMDEDVTKVSVPGALEIPFALMKLAQTEEYDALIALGAVIRGETYHFELVSNESGAGITRIGLDYEIPIANGVLTTENDEQCQERIEMKARDCAVRHSAAYCHCGELFSVIAAVKLGAAYKRDFSVHKMTVKIAVCVGGAVSCHKQA